jgi:metallophosphoesterase (TIGR03767 family)
MRRVPLSLCAVLTACAASVLTAVAYADPAGRTTLQETIRAAGSGFRGVVRGPGEGYVVRRGNAPARPGRARMRRSLVFFGQFTDPQLADEMSPLRAEFVDPVAERGTGSSGLGSAWRPQEAMGPLVFDRTIRNMNANRTSAVRQGNGARSRLQFVIDSGDMADNQHRNETRWFVGILNGGRIDPFSGQAITPTNNRCNLSQQEVARLNAEVAARRYTGVQDYDDWRGRPPDRYAGFWDPDEPAPVPGPYSNFPRYPGLMDRAQRPFTAQGSRVPWFTSRGNHDGLTQGVIASTNPLLVGLATCSLKVFPSASFDPASQRGRGYDQVIASLLEPANLSALLAGGTNVPPDANRQLVNKVQYKALHGRGTAHGYGFVSRAQNRASRGSASYYAFSRRGFRFIAIDTVAEGGGPNGNLDDPQYRWLESELRRARRANQLVIVYGHHGLTEMNNPNNDEEAGACSGTSPLPGCDIDPRRSTPIHLGVRGAGSLRNLLQRYPNVIATVSGHEHDNRILPYFRRGRGFWEIETSSHVDSPQQSRQIEVMNNGDGTLSIFTRVIDQSAPLRTPPAGRPAASFTDTDLASVARRLALNDPHVFPDRSRGRRIDRNVELTIRDPRP